MRKEKPSEFETVIHKMRELEDALGMPRGSTLDQLIGRAQDMREEVDGHEQVIEEAKEDAVVSAGFKADDIRVRANNRVRKIIQAMRDLRSNKKVVDTSTLNRLLGK